MKEITHQRLRTIIKEELAKVMSELDFSPFKGQLEDKDTLSPGLEVTHTSTGMDYVIRKIGVSDVELETPEGKSFIISKETLEKDYNIPSPDEEEEMRDDTTDEKPKKKGG